MLFTSLKEVSFTFVIFSISLNKISFRCSFLLEDGSFSFVFFEAIFTISPLYKYFSKVKVKLEISNLMCTFKKNMLELKIERSLVMDSQKKITRLYVLIAILYVLVLALGGYIVYDKTQNNKSSTTTTTDSTNSNTNTLVSKLDNNKDWVYDAEYTKNVTADSYSTGFKITYYSKDIVVPYINIDSSYAKNSNSDIKNVFDDAIKTFNQGVSNKMFYVDECSYKKHIYNDSLSVVLTYGIGATDVVHPNYYTYNIDLKTGNQLSYEEVYNIAGLSSSNIDSKVENAITKIMQDKLKDLKDPQKDTGDGGYYPSGTNFNTYNNESISNYKKSISNNTLKYFLSDNGELNIVVKLSIPVGTGEFDTIITID